MKKKILIITLLLFAQMLVFGCSKDVSRQDEKRIRETIDLVLSCRDGYDDTMKEHISEEKFYICNYMEFYSLYIGELNLEKYGSNIISIKEENGKYRVYVTLDMVVKALKKHGDEKANDEAVGEDVPVEVVMKEKDGELYIEGFTEYEDLERAGELNDGFK